MQWLSMIYDLGFNICNGHKEKILAIYCISMVKKNIYSTFSNLLV